MVRVKNILTDDVWSLARKEDRSSESRESFCPTASSGLVCARAIKEERIYLNLHKCKIGRNGS
jgi:hypothetical protein